MADNNDIGPFQDIVNVSWGTSPDVLVFAASILASGQSPTVENIIRIDSASLSLPGVFPFEILHAIPLNDRSGRPSDGAPAIPQSDGDSQITSEMGSFFVAWRYSPWLYVEVPENQYQNKMVVNLSKIKKLFPLATSISFNGSLVTDDPTDGIAQIGIQFLAKAQSIFTPAFGPGDQSSDFLILGDGTQYAFVCSVNLSTNAIALA